MNKKSLMYGIGLIGVAIIGFGVYLLINNNSKYTLKITVLDDCDNRAKVYYDDTTDKIYSYCLASVKVTVNEKEYELSTYLKDEKIKIKDFFNKLLKDETTWPSNISASDGGTKIYGNKAIGLIKCNRIIAEKLLNQDIYIGSPAMSFKSNYCLPNIKTITRTYKVLKVVAEGEFEVYLTLSANGKTATILYEASVEEFVKNKYYEFEFYTNDFDVIEDTIKALFHDAMVVSVSETDKVGNQQIQDPISDIPAKERVVLIENAKKNEFAQELIQYYDFTNNYYANYKVETGGTVPLCYIIDNYKDGYGYEGCMVVNKSTGKVTAIHAFDADFYYDGDYANLLDKEYMVINRITENTELTSIYVKGGSTTKCPATCVDPTIE